MNTNKTDKLLNKALLAILDAEELNDNDGLMKVYLEEVKDRIHRAIYLNEVANHPELVPNK